MSERERIVDQLKRAYEGNAWHGPALTELLANVTELQAARRPVEGAHSIWEVVLHINAWERAVRRRIEGEMLVELPTAEDWPPVLDTGQSAWKNALETLDADHHLLRQAILGFDERRFSVTVPGKPYDFYAMFHGVVQHDLYHAGQIAILKRAMG